MLLLYSIAVSKSFNQEHGLILLSLGEKHNDIS